MDELPPIKVAAIGYSIVGSISDNAQITFQHFIDADETDAAVNANIDRILGFVDRQRAKYEAPSLRKELEDLTDKMLLVDGDAANSEANFHKAQADLDVQIETYQGEIKRITEEGYTTHRSRGKQSSYSPSGLAKQQITAAEHGIRTAVEAKGRNENERQVFLSNIDTNKQRMAGRSDFLRGRLTEIEAQVT